jgi:hypothetical protein
MEPPVGVPGFEPFTGLFRFQRELPVLFRDKRLDLFFPVHDHAEGGRLDPPDREDVGTPPACSKRDEAGERGTPHQVDGLPGFTCCCKGKIEFRGMRKGVF